MSKIEKIDLQNIDWRGSREFFEGLTSELKNLDNHDESYDFTWVGKRKSIIEAGAPINKTLRPDTDSSKDWDTTENLFIEGDNLDALKLLQESYLNKVKMIYIDPPYNTGKDFVYHDNFRADSAEYAIDSGKKDEEGNTLVSEDEFKKNERSAGRFHSDWLSMMYPRLKLARNLLSGDGAIFISIDDNEQANLKKLCDEIFGEDNFVATLVWNTKNASKGVPPINMVTSIHESVLVYAKNGTRLRLNGIKRTTDDFSNPDNDERGLWRKEALVSTVSQKIFEITDPATGNRFNRPWAFSKDTIAKMIDEGRVLFPSTETGTPLQKKFFNDYTNEGTPIVTQIGTFQTRKATSDLMRMFDNKKIFDFSKPLDLLKLLIDQGTRPTDIILDFFAGSATTAHAVMQLNAEDGGNRRFIMVQLDEETDGESEAYKAGYKTIPEISRERIRRAGEKIKEDLADKLKDREQPLDIGFRALKIDSANENENIYKPAAEYDQTTLDASIDNIKKDRTPLDLLYGVLVACALEYNHPIETETMNGNTIYKYDYIGEVSGLIACFDDSISEETIKAIAKMKPLTAVFKNTSFENSTATVNLSEHFRLLSPETQVKVV